MKQTLFLCFLFGCCTTVFCQSGTLTGSVLDAVTKTPLELATVSVLAQDSVLITYKLCDKNGSFTFEKLPSKKNFIIGVSYTGYTRYYTTVQLKEGKIDTLNVLLAVNDKDTNSVVVTSRVPIRMNRDTIEINPGAFKLKEDAVVEELLNQVSGVTIWSDGTITVNGKKVKSLLVDGKPFMGSKDTRVATQNLPKSAIDKIQLYQEYDRSNINKANQPKDSSLTMNIKLKESSKKGYFGKVGVGYGTMKRFETDLSFQVYNKKSSAGIGGGFNNINKNIGNLQDIFQNNTYRTYNPNLYNVGSFDANGINKNHSIGGVFTHSFIETANSRQNNRIAVNYNKSGLNNYVTDLNLQNRTTINNQQFIRDEGVQNSSGDKHEVGINYVKTNSYYDNLDINGSANTFNDKINIARFTEVRDSANQLQSTNSSSSQENRRYDNETVNLNYAKANMENPLKSFSSWFNIKRENTQSKREVKSEFVSLTQTDKNKSFNRHYAVDNSNLNLSGSIDYNGFKRLLFGRYNFFGINVILSQWFNYARVTDNNRVTDYDSIGKRYLANTNLTNVNRRETLEYTPSVTFARDFSKYNEVYYRSLNMQVKLLDDIKTDKNISSFANRNLNRSFQFFRYEGNINFQYNKQRKYYYYSSLAYVKNFEYPSVDQLYTIVDDINVYDVRIGNPMLRNRINHTFTMNHNFNKENNDGLYSYNGNFNTSYVRSIDASTDSTINDPSGKRFTYATNAGKSSSLNLNYNFNISRRINKNNIQLMYNGRLSKGTYPNYIDRVYNVSETGSLYNQFNLQFSLRNALVLNVGETFSSYSTKQKAPGLASFKNLNNITKVGAVLNFPENFTFSSTVDYISNTNLAKPTILWNAFAGYRFMKQQGELKLSAMDLLKQYKNIYNNVDSYGTSTRVTNGLRQFFLLTFSYYPRRFGKTDVKRQAASE